MNNFEQKGFNDVDVTLGSFHFSHEEREAMKLKGMTEEEITAKEHDASNRIAQKQFEGEKKAA
jgi:hypothetical protein